MTILLIQSCLGGGSDYYRDRVAPFLKNLKSTYKAQVFDEVMEPAVFPDLDEDQETLVGIDSNHDGVRDDMEIFINRNFKYDYERETYKQFFKRAPGHYKNYKNMSLKELLDDKNAFMRDTECFRYLFGMLNLPESSEHREFQMFEALYNTPLRMAVLNYKSLERAGEAYSSGIRTDTEAFFTCPEKIKLKYPYRK